MSHAVNDTILERANDLLEEISGHPSKFDKLLEQAIEHNDLDEVYRLVTIIEGELAQEHFYNAGII